MGMTLAFCLGLRFKAPAIEEEKVQETASNLLHWYFKKDFIRKYIEWHGMHSLTCGLSFPLETNLPAHNIRKIECDCGDRCEIDFKNETFQSWEILRCGYKPGKSDVGLARMQEAFDKLPPTPDRFLPNPGFKSTSLEDILRDQGRAR